MEKESSFVFYRSFMEATDNCPENERPYIYEAIVKYALDGLQPKLKGSLKIVWPLIKPQLDANRVKRQNGRKGAALRKTTGYGESITNGSKTTTTTPSHSVKPNVNENENVNGNLITSYDQVLDEKRK